MRKLEKHEYDTDTGILRFLKHYPHFHAVLEERRKAANRGEVLHEFVILKTYTLDQFGEIGKIEPFVRIRELMKELPDCVDLSVFFGMLKAQLSPNEGYLAPVHIPPLYVHCAGCQKYFGTHDCHDVLIWRENDIHMPLHAYVGRQLWEVRRDLDSRRDASYFIHPNIQIQNDRFIEMRPSPYFERTSPENQTGWIGEEHGLTEWYVIQPGDVTLYSRTQYFHQECFRDWITTKTRSEFEQIFRGIGTDVLKMEVCENKYGSFEYRGPWFMVTTRAGIIRIGWRKRVIEIVLQGEWPVDCTQLFPDEEVTKERSLIHAWNIEKASEYIRTIMQTVAPA